MAWIASASRPATDRTWMRSMRFGGGSGIVSVTTSCRIGEACEALDGAPGEDRVDDAGLHGDRAALEHDPRGLQQGAAARHLVVHDQGDLALHVADQVGGARLLVVPVAALVDDGDRAGSGGSRSAPPPSTRPRRRPPGRSSTRSRLWRR